MSKSKFKWPKGLRSQMDKMLEESGGSIPAVNSWIHESAHSLITSGSVQMGWYDQEDVDAGMEQVTYELVTEHEKAGEVPDDSLMFRCSNQNDESGHIAIYPDEENKRYLVAVIHDRDSEDDEDESGFMDRVMYHTVDIGLMNELVGYLYKTNNMDFS